MIIFTLDIFFSMNTAIYSRGIIVKDKIEIQKKYFKKMFLLDFLSLSSIILVLLYNRDLFDLGFIFRVF